jgi:hypothetical protein
MGSDVLPQRREASADKGSSARPACPEGKVSLGLETQVPEHQSSLFAGALAAPVCVALAEQVPGPHRGQRLWRSADVGHACSARRRALAINQGSSAEAAPVGLQGPGMELPMAAIGPPAANAVAAAVGVTKGDGEAVADLDGGKAGEAPGHGCRPRPPPLAVMVPLGDDAWHTLVDEPHGCVAHLVSQRAPQLGLCVDHPGAQLDLDQAPCRPMDGGGSR